MAVDEDESVRIAVRALGDMRNSGRGSPPPSSQHTPALTIASGISSPSLPSPSYEDPGGLPDAGKEDDSHNADRRAAEDADFVSRMSKVPIVNSALRVYENSKASSRMVKYGAQMMETSMKTISRPVIDRLPVNQLDEFACRQLDRIENYTRRTPSRDRESSRGRSTSVNLGSLARDGDTRRSRDVSMVRDAPTSHSIGIDDQEGPSSPSRAMQVDSRTPTPHPPLPNVHAHTQSPFVNAPSPTRLPPIRPRNSGSPSATTPQPDAHQVAQRSRWQTMLLEAGGISAAVSEESMRRLRYCLQWLQYATAHIDAQILVLRNFIASLQPSSPSQSACIVLSSQHLRTLNAAKRDVVETLRQVVDVVSRYAGGALPEPARTHVRTFILRLPRRWAEAANVNVQSPTNGSADGADSHRTNGSVAPYNYDAREPGSALHSRPPSRTSSPHQSRAPSRQASGGSAGIGLAAGGIPTTADAATQAAQRILTLATESLDMLRGVTAVVSDSLDRADAWVERLRLVGLQRQQGGAEDPEGPPTADAMRDLQQSGAASYLSGAPLPSLFAHRQPRANSPTSPISPFAQLSPLSASTANSGRATPVHPLSRSSSSPAFSMLPGSSIASFYTASGSSLDAGGAAASLNALSLSSHSAAGSVAGSRYATPKSASLPLPSEGDTNGGMYFAGSRGEKRAADGDDDTVVAATALAGMAGSAAKRVKKDNRMDVDSRER
ncbi:Opi1-domain-containing protein [Wolfiporia cocos MD-104 SS10]|uniref:Opi1-domain-containing protein n=1 Tax=Wolfiporia cocos (strain MD-104) TaxID=742152 RepID=A0A2H3JRE8_WOLCO|nr:Opi1-domain-containing protein [Wolfiporia cocos MD-104 SS10]